MNYRSLSQLTDQVWAWARELPNDVDLLVGVPRSGLLVANLLAVFRNLPLTDVEGLLEGRVISTGRRYKGPLLAEGSAKPLRVLVVDDSVWGGGTMRRVKAQLAEAGLPHRFHFGAVYVRPGFEREVDSYCEVLDIPRLFEWNVMHHKVLHQSCMEIDGILCPVLSVTPDSPAAYREAVATARPLLLPTEKVGWLVTARPETYRRETEAWLATHGVDYGELVMLDSAPPVDHRAAAAALDLKADAYERTEAKLFYEASPQRALQLVRATGKPVFCVETMQMVNPGEVLESRFVTPRHSTLKRLLTVTSLRVKTRVARGMRAARGLMRHTRTPAHSEE